MTSGYCQSSYRICWLEQVNVSEVIYATNLLMIVGNRLLHLFFNQLGKLLVSYRFVLLELGLHSIQDFRQDIIFDLQMLDRSFNEGTDAFMNRLNVALSNARPQLRLVMKQLRQ